MFCYLILMLLIVTSVHPVEYIFIYDTDINLQLNKFELIVVLIQRKDP